MKILYSIPFSGSGGSEQQLLNTLQQASHSHSADIHVITSPFKGPLFSEYEKYATVHEAAFDHNFDLHEKGIELIKEIKPQLLHIQRPGGEGFPQYISNCIFDIPIVLTTLCDRDEGAIPWADAHIVPSNFSKSLQTGTHSIEVVPHSVASKTNVRPSSSLVNTLASIKRSYSTIVVRVGTLDSVKLPHINIEVAKRFPHIAFIIGGRDIYNFSNNFAQFTPPKNVFFLYDLSEEDKWYVLNQSDICLYPTTKEAQGLAMIEPMMAGCPVISIDDSVNRETVEENGYGVICNPTLDEITATLEHMLKHKSSMFNINQEKERVIRFYHPKQQWVKMAKIYRRVLYVNP
jgi:glycosyltransferase involved in cell wall biosynthesis